MSAKGAVFVGLLCFPHLCSYFPPKEGVLLPHKVPAHPSCSTGEAALGLALLAPDKTPPGTFSCSGREVLVRV